MYNIQYIRIIIISAVILPSSKQNCPQEVSENGIRVTWHESPSGSGEVESDPICYYKEHLVKRYCNDSGWTPSIDELEPCLKVVDNFNLSSCPPGFHKISDTNNEYCYQISETSAWNYPCFTSGGASVITDLNSDDVDYLLDSLNKSNKSKLYWLPAQRQKLFNPVVWYIPGPNWGRPVDMNNKLSQTNFNVIKNCLLIDVEKRVLVTESCNKNYPSLCFYLNDLHYPAMCPSGYYAFRFMPDNGTCYGIEQSDTTDGLNFENFLMNKCNKPMGDENNYLKRFIFMKIAEMNYLPDDTWCWFTNMSFTYNGSDIGEVQNNSLIVSEVLFHSFEGIINNQGILSMMNKLFKLPCMACETDMIYGETSEPELTLDYSPADAILYLTIYFPSGLWKYDINDIGIQCFSDARGFVKVIAVNDIPFMEVNLFEPNNETESSNVEKVVYAINLVTDSSAQYWCEGHTTEFTLITSNKIVANPRGNKIHVFALMVKIHVTANIEQDFTDIISKLILNTTTVFEAERVLPMEILGYTLEHMLVLLHLHVAIKATYENEAKNLLDTYNILKKKAEIELPNYDISFVNITSSLYCLPTTTVMASMMLNWDLTLIGHIASPTQFCLQTNGLPVKRQCNGSYRLGGIWGDIEGQCDVNHEPTATTTFLYNFVKGHTSENCTSRFLTDGLNFVLGDVDIIIPADIYYLSMSLQQVINVAQENISSVDMGDIENIAWAMDRVMILDEEYLLLAQTLNSSNVILDSVNDIIKMLTQNKINFSFKSVKEAYQLVVKSRFLVQVSFPEFTNITGIAAVRTSESNSFSEMTIIPLYKNTTLDEILLIKNLEVATWIPENLLNSLKPAGNSTEIKDIYIVITIFHNDAVFQQLDKSNNIINSRIIGISIPGFISNLKHSVPLVFKEMKQAGLAKICGYWDFQSSKSRNHLGSWSNRGCYFVQSIDNITVCECYHMTHFGQLFDLNRIYSGGKTIDKHHIKVLNIITLVGSFLSLFGIIGIWVTAFVFQAWRKKPSTKILLQLSTSIALPLLFIIVFNLDNTMFIEINGVVVIAEHMKYVCIVLGALLHYSILASFMWMLITAILQFIRYVRVLGVGRPSRFIVKFMLIGWGIPLIPVAVILTMDTVNYIPDPNYEYGNYCICYPQGFYLVTCVLIPILLILIINVILFVLVIISISRGPDGKRRATDVDLVGAQLRLSILLFFLLGLTWIFGIFSFSSNLLWSYLFCLTSSLQGLVLFIYFVICDPTTRSLWLTLMKPQFITTPSRNSISSISSS